MEKTEHGRTQGLPKFMRCSKLSQERLKLWTSNLAGTFAGSLQAKGNKNFGDKWRGRSQGLSKIFRAAIYSLGRIARSSLR